MFGHPVDNLLWAPDPRDDLAFTMYAMDCEHSDAYEEASALIANAPSFYCVDDVIDFIESEDVSIANQLGYVDYVNLFKAYS